MNNKSRSNFLALILLVMLLFTAGCQAAPTASVLQVEDPTLAPALTDTPVPPAAPTDTPVPAPTNTPVTVPAGKTISGALLLDPALAGDPDSMMINQYLYEGLVRLNASGAPEPALAESWVISDDGLSYIFTLRANIAFSDGKPITTDVIETNFNRWFDRAHPLRGGGSYKAWERVFLGFRGDKGSDDRAKSLIDGVQKVDQFTVLIHLSRPVPELLTYLADPAFAILSPERLTGEYGARGSQIISSGAYLVESWTESELKLSPNPLYWGSVPAESLLFNLR
jgi:peptide/nickel transport system substrate-binding protein